jgi:small basic protein (TIGR04137 family)
VSLHKSFSSKGGTGGHRNVLTRAERLAKLKDEERWKDGSSVFGIPKVRSIKPKKKGKAAKKAEGTEAGGAAAAPAAAPAATPAADKGKAAKPPEKEKKK